ncbi:MAG: hypothetical protein NVS1B4_23100 [Gemmatimonadaceae bacterium]
MLTNPWSGLALLVLLLLAMLGVIRVAQARLALPPELARKGAHIGLGLATLSFPLLFHEVWPVAVIVGAAVAVLVAMRWVAPIRSRWGSVVDGVERRTWGGVYFPIAAGLLFVVARDRPVLFEVPILTLTLADAAAALIGVHYGRTSMRTTRDAKTVEGSIAFFTTAFLTTHIPLLLFTTTGRVESLLIGAIVGLLVMMMEAVSLRGSDNILIPFGGYLLLDGALRKGPVDLATALAVVLLFLGVAIVLRKQRTLSDTAVLAGVLIGFVSWAAGGWRWVMPPMVTFLSYTLLWPRRRQVRERPHEPIAVAAVAAAGMVWLVAAFALDLPGLYYPYTIAFAANLCFIGITWYRLARPRRHPLLSVTLSAAKSWLVLFVPYAVIERHSIAVIPTAAAALLWLVAGGMAFSYLIPDDRDAETRWVSQSVLGFAASALGLVVIPVASLRAW